MERRSIKYGGVSLLFVAVFFFLTRFMRTRPYGENDFDLILMGLYLVDLILGVWTVLLGVTGFVLGIIGMFRKPPRWVPAIGAVTGIMALVLVGFTLLSYRG